MEQQYHRPSDEDEDGESTRSSAGENISSQIERGAPLPSSSYSQQMHSKDSPALHPRSQENAASSQQGEASETQRIRYNGNAENAKFPKPLFTELTQHAMFQPSSPDLNSSTSPRFSNGSQALDKGHYSFFQPTDRSLPSTEVTDETLDDAYVQFILYCNPTVDLSVDSHELRRIFRAPPKSDGNSFSTFTLLELIRKLEAKEIKTWTQLAIKLGVEPPSTEKGQSTQKVQQYAVRLKRWMRAMHVDAFFEYCLGKPHVYYMQIPPDEGSLAQLDRDGVPPEEDLAIRALRPESRPKRGRRKTEEKDTDSGRVTPAKRPHLDTSVATVNPENFNSAHSLFRDSGLPSTARTDDLDGHSQRLDPWTAASNITPRTIGSQLSAQPMTPGTATGGPGGLHFRWRVNAREGSNTPSTPVGYSSATPISALPPDSAVDEPSSAITSSPGSSKNRARRRHGPAVSSAWPSGGNPVTGKLRGRPPSNRSVRDGPFSTFPANPKTREGPVIDLQGTPVSTPITGRDDANDARRRFNFSPQAPSPLHHQGPIKPGALQLQVPHHVGGAVRLATPTVLVNGESDGDPPTTVSSAEPHRESMRQLQHAKLPPRVDELVQHLGSKLMVAAIVNGATGFDFTLGKRLALQVLEDLQAGGQTSRKDNAPPELFAVYFGLLSDLGMPMGVDAVMKDLRVQMASDTEVAARNRTQTNGPSSAQSFLLSWTMGLGALSGNMTMLVSLPYEEFNEAPNGSSSGPSDDATSWKERFFELQKRTDERSASTRRKVLEALL